MTIRILLADDQALLRATFKLLIDSTADLQVVGEASNGHEAVAMTREIRPDIVLMDIRMPELDGIAATEQITIDSELAAVKIIILTTFETENLVIEALRAGASAYLGKGIEPADLLDAIRTVAAGNALLSPDATRALISNVVAPASTANPASSSMLDALTPRETEILVLVGLGLSNDEIASELVISPTTAKTHINRTMSKLGARDRAHLVITAYESGLVTPGQRPA